MNVITITREFGSGGAELARLLAAALGWNLLDRELLHSAGQVGEIPDAELERLDEQAISMSDLFRLRPPHQKYLDGLRRVAVEAAERGRVILVGRGARHLLGERSGCLHLRLVAPQAWRAERLARLEGKAPEVALAECMKVDRTRRRFHRCFFGETANDSSHYDLVVNTGRVPLQDVADTIVELVRVPVHASPEIGHGEKGDGSVSSAKRVLTLSREFGAGDQGFAPPLAERLGLRIYDRKLLERQAVRLGVPESELEKFDEQPAGVFGQLLPDSFYHKYIKALEQLSHELADGGEVLLVGRGGSWFLRDRPNAFHVHLTATLATRVRRVMEYRWVREEVARKLIARSDAQRRSFCHDCFGADWTDPLEYHLTVNSGRLGPLAVDAVARAAQRHWSRRGAARS
ncbi:MAG: cytidylate kinase family protein [Pirellulaceae bacterium]|nr:cytidylate kinase family protein [Pirellulaceae bacterium]